MIAGAGSPGHWICGAQPLASEVPPVPAKAMHLFCALCRWLIFVMMTDPQMAGASPSLGHLLPGKMRPTVSALTIPILVSALLGICCYLIAGNSLDLFIGSVLLLCVLTPPLAAIAGRLPGVCLSTLGISVGIGGAWMLLVFRQSISLVQWGSCMLVLISLLLLMAMAMWMLIRLGCSVVAGSASVTILAMGWLTFPVWLSGGLSGTQLHWSVLLHPLLVINGILPQLGIWTEQQAAYGLTNLGQDAQYSLPASVWPVVGFHLVLTAVMICIGAVLPERISAK